MKRQIDAARDVRGANDTTDVKRVIFMDVGGWHGGWKSDDVPGDSGGTSYSYVSHTDFGLVSDKDVLLCSWLNIERDSGIQPDVRKLSPAAQQFFNTAMSHGRHITVMSHERALTSLTSPPRDLILFVPDLHLSLFREARGDIFKYDPDFRTAPASFERSEKAKRLKSLEGELAGLLQVANTCHAQIVQVGDCFEMWEAQAHLIDDYDQLYYYVWESRDREGIVNLRIQMPEPFNTMWKYELMIPRVQYIAHVPIWYPQVEFAGLPKNPTPDDVKRRGIPVHDNKSGLMKTIGKGLMQDQIKKAIMESYPLIFKNPTLSCNDQGLPFTWLEGNHDNMWWNNFYTRSGRGQLHEINHAREKPLPITDLRLGASDGTDYRIAAEHGHRADPNNRDENFDQDSLGYDVTRANTLSLRGTGDQAWWAGLALEVTAEMTDGAIGGATTEDEGALARTIAGRLDGMRKAQMERIFCLLHEQGGDFIRLVVMGHTHRPCLATLDTVPEYLEYCEAQGVSCD